MLGASLLTVGGFLLSVESFALTAGEYHTSQKSVSQVFFPGAPN